jgi:glutathione S-transferase
MRPLAETWRITTMERKRVKQELREMLEAEERILEALALNEGTEKDQDYLCSKLFELADYILALQDYLERTRKQ